MKMVKVNTCHEIIMLNSRQLSSKLVSDGLTPSLRQLKDCRHTFPSSGGNNSSSGEPQRTQGCFTCNVGRCIPICSDMLVVYDTE